MIFYRQDFLLHKERGHKPHCIKSSDSTLKNKGDCLCPLTMIVLNFISILKTLILFFLIILKNILTANIIAFIKPSLFSLLVLFAIQLILNIMDTILLTCALLLLMLAIQLLSDLINSVFYAMTALKIYGSV